MKIHKILSAFMLICLFSCNQKINQYIKVPGKAQQRHGKWVEHYPAIEGEMTASGKYKNGEKIGVWKTIYQNKLYQKDVTRNNVTKTKVYHPNGKIMEKGMSKVDISTNERHWYYFGDWKYYDEQGNLKYIKKYDKGKKVDSLSFTK
ncbi:hypothetical protein [Chryseobacterium sp.]|uniref:hypothetical protein n=1 Tax=Chryseobacterium sp. TaxID=1871047 RepID=UPI0028A14F69|nr:hypothetical protein [Chryseobacterium sp.]